VRMKKRSHLKNCKALLLVPMILQRRLAILCTSICKVHFMLKMNHIQMLEEALVAYMMAVMMHMIWSSVEMLVAFIMVVMKHIIWKLV
jgi:hypothetical protein